MRARLSSKGQIVLPKKIREKQGWEPGVELDVKEVPEGVLLRPIARTVATSVEDLLGCTGYQGPRKSLADMEAAVRAAAKARR